MDMEAFARAIVLSATTNRQISLIPMTQRDLDNRCILRFRLGTTY